MCIRDSNCPGRPLNPTAQDKAGCQSRPFPPWGPGVRLAHPGAWRCSTGGFSAEAPPAPLFPGVWMGHRFQPVARRDRRPPPPARNGGRRKPFIITERSGRWRVYLEEGNGLFSSPPRGVWPARRAPLPGTLNNACTSVGACFVSPAEPPAHHPMGVVLYCSFLL